VRSTIAHALRNCSRGESSSDSTALIAPTIIPHISRKIASSTASFDSK
jgi:hypothetical protein